MAEDVYLRYKPNSDLLMFYKRWKRVPWFPVRVAGTLFRSAWVPILSVTGDWSDFLFSTRVWGDLHQPVWAWRLDHYDHPIWNWQDYYYGFRHDHSRLDSWVRTLYYELRSDYICSKPSKVLRWPIGCLRIRDGREEKYCGHTKGWQPGG